jgi:excisionase family DNA binding protein
MHSRTIDTGAISATGVSMFVSSQSVNPSITANSAISNTVRKPPVSESWTPEPLLDSEQAAAIMKVHPKTLQKLARQGRIPGVHVGKLWRFRASVIEAWIAQQMAS